MSDHMTPKDGVPSEPISITGAPHLQHQVKQSGPNSTSPALPYDSNPFTISIRGFQLLMKFAQSIVITILLIGLFSFTFNIVGQIIPAFFEETLSAQQDDVSETLESTRQETREDFNRSLDLNLQDDSLSSSGTGDEITGSTIAAFSVIAIGIFLMVLLITLPVGIAFSAGYKGFIAAGAVAAIQHRNIAFGEALAAMANRFGTLFVAELIMTLKVIGGYILFIVPGVRAQLRYEALPYIIMNDSTIGAKAAVAQTKELYKKHLMEVFGIRFFAGIIPAIGQAFAAGGIGLSLQQITAYKQANLATPKTHWLNYIGLIVVAALFLLLVLFGIVLGFVLASA